MSGPAHALIFIVLISVTSGCAALRIKVDVLEPQVVESEIDRLLLRDSLPRVLAQSDTDLIARFEELRNKHFKFRQELANAYRREATKLSGAAGSALGLIANTMVDAFRTEVVPRYRAEETEALALNKRIKDLHARLAAATPETREAVRSELVSKLRERQTRFESFDREIRRDVDKQLKDGMKHLPTLADRAGPEAAVRQTEAEVAQARKSLIAGQGLVESPYAYVVAAAPDSRWSPRFNRTVGEAVFGNFNFAVKMVSLGDFTIKGLTFDPSDVARAVSKIAVQALVLSAQLSGVPIKPPTTPTTPAPDGTAVATASGRIAELEEAAARRDAKLQDYRAALITLGLAIVREQPKIAGQQTDRDAAVRAIKGTYNAHKSRLNLDELQGSR